MKKIIVFLSLFLTFTFTQNAKETQIYFSLPQPNPQCVELFVKLIKTSNYEFKAYGEK